MGDEKRMRLAQMGVTIVSDCASDVTPTAPVNIEALRNHRMASQLATACLAGMERAHYASPLVI